MSWNSNFPVPPRMMDGLLNAPPTSRNQYERRRNDYRDESVYDQRPPKRRSHDQQRDYGTNHPKPLMEDGYVLESTKIYRSNDGMQRESPTSIGRDFRVSNGHIDPADYDRRQQQPQSLLDKVVVPPLITNDNFRIPKQDANSQRRSSYNNSKRGGSKTDDYRFNRNRQYNRDHNVSPFEKKAIVADLTSDFFDKVKPLKMMQAATDIALEYTRKEMDEIRGGNTNLVQSSFVPGIHSCTVCRINFNVRNEATDHFKTREHLEVEDLFKLKKEQARLIIQKKILKPNKESPKPPHVTIDVNPDMLVIAKAEADMELKPTEMELDPYILGIYESIMKPYWPSPSSDYYCRICNYVEFDNERDFDQHNLSKEHLDHEKTYDDAFCLYCQIHNGTTASMLAHSKTSAHEKIRDLMEKSKQTAIEHWHRVNGLELPEKYKPQPTTNAVKDTSVKDKEPSKEKKQEVGTKRSAPDPPDSTLKSPVKKATMSKEIPKTEDAVKLENNITKECKPVSSAVKKTNGAPQKDNDKELLPREKAWFIPVTGYMCAACQTFVEEKNQKAHVKEITHNTNIIKFKRQINS